VEYLLSNIQYPISNTHYQNGYWIVGIRYWAAFLAGTIYAFGSYRLVYAAIGHYNLWSTEWFPFYALFLIKTIREARLRNAVLAGIFMLLTLLCDMMHGVFLGGLSLVILAFVLRRRNRQTVAGGLPGLAKRLAVLGLLVTILYAPLWVPVLREMFGGYELSGWGDVEKLSVDLAGLVTPTALHPLGGDWVDTLRQTREGTARFRDVNTVFLGWAGLALAVVGALRYRRRLAAWITSAVIFAVLSLGPLLQINGRSLFRLDGLETTVPLPFLLLHYIPVVKANRVPNRFSLVLMLALAVLAGFGSYWLLRQVGRFKGLVGRTLLAACCLLLPVLLLFDHWSVPLPLTDARIPEVYEQVAADPGDFAILQLPLGWRNSFGVQGAESTLTQYYQTYHHKRLLSGNTSRNPPFKFDYFRQVPILDSLISLQTYGQVDAERRAADRATAAEFVRFYDVRYVVVAPGVPGRPPYVDTRDEAVAYVEEVLPLEKVYDRDGWLLYRVEQSSAAAATVLDLGSGGTLESMALGEGWAGVETIQGASGRWAVGQEARIFLPAAGAADRQLALTALPFDYPGAGEQGVVAHLNGQRLERLPLAAGWGTYTWQVPAAYVRPGLNDLRLSFDRLDAPADVLPGQATIGSTGVQVPTAIEVNSGGLADFAYITIGEGEAAEDGSVHSPGYNLAVVDAESGELLDRRGFDTTPGGGEAQAVALAEFIDSLPAGQIVVVALQGDGTAYLTDGALAALRSIGGQIDPRHGDGPSQAIVGVKGAAPGTALEAVGVDGSWLRVAPDRRTLAIALDRVEWQAVGEP
jgi:hypothetical protein